jgi:mannose-6-phosphate isomerase-like protein (cupin superfamily)
MRIAPAATLAATLLVGSVIAVSAQTAGPAMAMKPGAAMAMKPGAAMAMKAAAAPGGAALPLQTFDVPMKGKPQTVYILKRIFAPGDHIGFHTHDGVEITQVISGTIELSEKGHPTKVYHGGDSFIIPRGVVHDPKNIGTTDAQIAVTYVLDKDAPLKVMAK